MATITATRKSVIAKAIELENVWTPDEMDVLVKMLASLEKPRKKSDEPTKTQLINANLADRLVEVMRQHGDPVSAKWIAENVDGIATAQKAVAVVHAAGERITKFYDQRQALYRLS